MSAKPDGGPAYPIQGIDHESAALVMSVGLSLRDYFAGQAMIALMSNSRWVTGLDEALEAGKFKAGLSQHAYMLADAMIAERSKP